MYATGTGLSQSDQEAVRLFKMAAEAGDEDAQTSLALAYLLGKGVPKDLQQALFWSELAGNKGGETANMARQLSAKNLSPTEVDTTKRQVKEWQRK
jgi:TPR repeat protein